MAKNVLEIEDLRVNFPAYTGTVQAVRGVSLSMQEGEILALVGESGCGKSVTASSILRLNPAPPAVVTAARLQLAGADILAASEGEMEGIRGRLAGMVFQNPLTFLDPTMKVGQQITETLRLREKKSAAFCKREALRLLELVRIPDAALRAGQYPHQFSGGMRQRAMIAMALARSPRLLIADEPTTALDVTVQLQILRLFHQIRTETGCAVLLITHDMSVVAHLADRVAVMYAGKIVEQAPAQALFDSPAHPYTGGLLSSLPQPGSRQPLTAVPGSPPDLLCPPAGCGFAPRCPHCMNICLREEPDLFPAGQGHSAACWLLHPECAERGRA